jgi:hypothetical protein
MQFPAFLGGERGFAMSSRSNLCRRIAAFLFVLTMPSWLHGQAAFLESSGQVVMEAENFTSSAAGTGSAASKTWNSVTVSGSSAGCRQALTNSGITTNDTLNGPRLDYRVKFVTTGTYYIWVRCSRQRHPCRFK